jgi:hypothetical protein
MIKIFVRSPYFIEINETNQTGSKIEVFVWNKGQTEPTTPRYTQSKAIVSSTQTKNIYNVSNYALEFINPTRPIFGSTIVEENVNTWCYMKVKRYALIDSEYSLLTTETFVCLNGYTNFLNEYNQGESNEAFILANPNIKRYQTQNNSHYVNCWIEQGGISLDYNGVSVAIPSQGVYRFPLVNGTNDLTDVFIVNIENVCESIYDPIKVSFVNSYSGWEHITLFKSPINNFSSTSKDYNLLQKDINYSIYKGKKQTFNHELKQKVKANTGWVRQDFIELLTELMTSETILIDDKPAILLTKDIEEKTTIRDNNIFYELEFEYNYNLINDVV